MVEYGTKVVGGVTPGRGGAKVWEIPVYDTVKKAVENHGLMDMSVTFVPAPLVRMLPIEAWMRALKTIVMPVERVPLHDILEMVARAKRRALK